jgi:hypothetical protein
MSVYFDNDTDHINATLTTLTIGTGSVSVGCWMYLNSDTNAQGDVWILNTPQLGMWVLANGTDLGGFANSHDTNTVYVATVGTWYWVAVTMTSGTTLRTRIYSDDPSSTTPLSDQSRSDFSLDYTTVTSLIVGNAGAAGASPVKVQNFKIQTGVLWTDAEARTEALYYGIRKSGGTDRLCWRLKGITADTDGLNEDAAAPTNLSEAGGGPVLAEPAARGPLFNMLIRM